MDPSKAFSHQPCPDTKFFTDPRSPTAALGFLSSSSETNATNSISSSTEINSRGQMALLLPPTALRSVSTPSPVNVPTHRQHLYQAATIKPPLVSSEAACPTQPLVQHPFQAPTASYTQRHGILEAESAPIDPSTLPRQSTNLDVSWSATRQPILPDCVLPHYGTPQTDCDPVKVPLTVEGSPNAPNVPNLQATMQTSIPLQQDMLSNSTGLPFSTSPLQQASIYTAEASPNFVDRSSFWPPMMLPSGDQAHASEINSLGLLLPSMQQTCAQDADGLAAMSKSLDDMLATTSAFPPSCTSFPHIIGSAANQQVIDYKRSLTEAHSGRLGGLGLPHPLPEAVDLEATNVQQTVDVKVQAQTSTSTALKFACSKEVEVKRILASPRAASSAAIFILNHIDGIVWSGSVADFLQQSEIVSHTYSEPQTTLSNFLADEQTVRWWQQACREVLIARRQLHELSEQSADSTTAMKLRKLCKKELVLRRRNKSGRTELVEVTVASISHLKQLEKASVIVKVRPMSIPALATVSSQPVLPSLRARQDVFSSQPALSQTMNRRMAADTAELRLLVSRYGLILRITCPIQPQFNNERTSPHQHSHKEQITKILGPASSIPSLGQNLVDFPKLTPLLHVVAQAAVVGLAQTVNLKMEGKQVTAAVQPVLRTTSSSVAEAGRHRLTAAKVWISLSVPMEATGRSNSSTVVPTVGFANSLSQFIGLSSPQQTHSNRPVTLDRRRSVQVPPHPTMLQADHRASTASLHAHTAVNQAWRTGQPISAFDSRGMANESKFSISSGDDGETVKVEDHLTQLIAGLEIENRRLRQKVHARLQRRQKQALATSRNATTSQATDNFGVVNIPSSCPSNLMHLS